MTSESLWNYCQDEVNDNVSENNNKNCTVNNEKTTGSKYEYKTKIIGSTPINNNTFIRERPFSGNSFLYIVFL